jgi:ParB family transcriptional regulator, chromosome partitioning protein
MGRGLAAILPAGAEQQERLHQIPVELIRPNPRQPRKDFDQQALEQLAVSIAEHGLLQPVLLRPIAGSGYELIAGERRWRAAMLAGVERVPAVVRSSQDTERLELALIENMARQDLNPVEAARACAALVEELELTKEEVGRRVGRSRVAISNLVRLLDLPSEVLAMLERGELSEGHGRALLQAHSTSARRAIARQARDNGLSVRETEARARAADGASPTTARPPLASADAEAARIDAQEALAAALGMEVRVRLRGDEPRVELRFEDLAELHQLARRLARRLAA